MGLIIVLYQLNAYNTRSFAECVTHRPISAFSSQPIDFVNGVKTPELMLGVTNKNVTK